MCVKKMAGFAQFQMPLTMDYTAVAVEQQPQEQQEEMEDGGMGDLGDQLNMKQKNTLPLYGNKETMNINPMILSNIQGSAYFKEELYKLKTFHEVIDEIFYKVSGYGKDELFSFSLCDRWSTWSRGRRGAGSWRDKWGCVEG